MVKEKVLLLSDKVAVITGGGNGIGKASAIEFARAGAKVAILDRDGDSLIATAGEIEPLNSEVLAVKADVTRSLEVKKAIDATLARFGRIDILVNNAGIARPARIQEMTEEQWDEVIAVTLKGMFLCTRAVVKHMAQQKYGVIINMSSVAGREGSLRPHANYGAAKAGVIGFTKSVAWELAGDNIRVNAVAPGPVMTELFRNLVSSAAQKKLRAEIPLGRFATPGEIAQLLVFLASDKASYMTGQVIGIDGGMFKGST